MDIHASLRQHVSTTTTTGNGTSENPFDEGQPTFPFKDYVAAFMKGSKCCTSGGALVSNESAKNAGNAPAVPRVLQCPYSDVRLKQAGKVNAGLSGFCVQPSESPGVSKTLWDECKISSLSNKLGVSAEKFLRCRSVLLQLQVCRLG